jgi:hypothetical protein
MQDMSTVRRDFIVGHLRNQLTRLRGILNNMEEEKVDCDYATSSLREIEVNLRQIRKLCASY